ncbi:hypothetical protein GW17_00042979 [Ensete ventricosum]|nr:hypothetical protein GW17_00042979 [Ensete ventricosum]
MDLSTLRGMPKMSIGKSTLVAQVAPSSPEVEEVRVKATSGTAQAPTPKRADGRPASPQKDGKVAPRIYRRPKSMKDLCGTTVRKDDEGYYILQITDLHPRDPDFELGVLHPQLAKELYVLPSEVLIAQATKQIVLGHHYQMALLDRVHDIGQLVTIMDHNAANLQQEIENLKSGSGPKQVATAEERANEKLMAQLVEATQRMELSDKELNGVRAGLSDA